MRIAVLGDFHIQNDEIMMTEQAMEDINRCEPDLVIPLGDFGTHENIGSKSGLAQAHALLSRIRAPKRPILGNHDLQRESGAGTQPKGTMEREMVRLFALEEAYGVMEFEHYRLFFIGTDPQPEDSCYHVQECYVQDEQFAKLKRDLHRRPGIPAILFTHAPPLGCGLRTVPNVHVRSTNAYLDQNHFVHRWNELFREHREIKMWFSAHYHLSHIYPDSCTKRHETVFFATGVHGSCTRDGRRHSRIVDIEREGIQVWTLDHATRRILAEPDWRSGWVSKEIKAHTTDNVELEGIYSMSRMNAFPFGDRKALHGGILPLDDNRCLVAAADGFLWEAAVDMESVLGTLHLGEPLEAVAVSQNELWRAWGNRLAKSQLDDMWRFRRESFDPEGPVLELESAVTALCADTEGTIWAGCGRQLLQVSPSFESLHVFQDPIVQMDCGRPGHNLAILTAGNQLFEWNSDGTKRLFDNAVAMHICEDERACILRESGQYVLWYERAQGTTVKTPLSMKHADFIEDSGERIEVACLGGGLVLVNAGGKLMICGEKSGELPAFLSMPGKKVTTTAVQRGNGGDRLFLATESSEPFARPELEVWNYRINPEQGIR